ncbi:hypothetical protein [Chitinophaga eiseniae]|uniref:Uncharacterized protein n=1 Tax=Chitinophaga eiseniae TaxID=634771 RepID=A0A847SPZ8_9BACT|nr:hypothetical protein [Chitinophaga eiseniae]NLR78132.1 hypothetical protein [Chitinophaga eiseniae]
MRHSLVRNIMLVLLPLLWWTISSCQKEKVMADTVPDFYTLPQGNQPYDDSIVAFHKQYGAYILYKFTPRDFGYDYTHYLRATATQANPAYVANTLRFFKSQCLDFYPESFLQKTMPFRILLAAAIDTMWTNRTTYGRSVPGVLASSTMMAVGWADSTLQQQLPGRLKELRGYLHRAYALQNMRSGALKIPADFLKYLPESYFSLGWDMGAQGLVETFNDIDALDKSEATDFAGFVGMITTHTKAELDTTFLSPAYDTKGLVLAKYNAVINFYKDLGVDLQAIGNHN